MPEQNRKYTMPELFQRAGMLFPTTPEEVDAFESKEQVDKEEPKSWNNPLEILKREHKDITIASIKNISQEDVENLGMAAREGRNDISEAIRKKMNLDRRDAENKK